MNEVGAEDGRAKTTHPFRFTGSGGEYFRIWIVNLLLSVVTLGVYSAWATVRTRRYFYGNTLIAGSGLEYHASPVAILIGRIAALAVGLAFTLVTNFAPLWGLALLILLAVATPFIVVRALRFQAAMSSWRGIHFEFRGGVGGAFGAYVGWPLLGALTLGLALPYAWFKSAQYGVNGHRFGQAPLRLSANAGDFYVLGLLMVFAGFGIGVLVTVATILLPAQSEGADDAAAMPWAVLGLYFLSYAFIYALYSGLRFQIIYRNLEIGEGRIHNDLDLGRYLWISATNLIGLVATLGFLYPWARTRIAGCLVRSLRLEASDIDGITASERRRERAFGEELGQALDLGIGV